MSGKFSSGEKIAESISVVLLILACVVKGVRGASDTGILVALTFVAILLFVLLFVAALFPADWRMTARQKEKIADTGRFQEKYRKIFVLLNLIVSIIMALVIWFVA